MNDLHERLSGSLPVGPAEELHGAPSHMGTTASGNRSNNTGVQAGRGVPRMPTCSDYGLSAVVEADVKFRDRWLGSDPRTHHEIQSMRTATELWVKRCLNDDMAGRVLILAGRFGTGKSRVARRAIKAIATMGISAWHEKLRRQTITTASFNWSELAQIGPMERNDQSAWIDAIESGAALIDDIGTEVDKFKSGATTENLRLLLEARRNLWTIYTTNIPPEKWSDCWDRRVDDRLRRNSVIVEIKTAGRYDPTQYF